MKPSSTLRSAVRQLSRSTSALAVSPASRGFTSSASAPLPTPTSTSIPLAFFTPGPRPTSTNSGAASRLCDNFFISHRLIRPRPYSSTSSSSSSPSPSSSGDTQLRMLLVGCPGSGKGTQSTRLLHKYDIAVIAAGDVLRSHIRKGTEIGKKAEDVIKAGGLMPDEVMMELIGSEVEALADRDWLLDGFPRTYGQAKMLDQMLDKKGKQLKIVVNLDVPEEVILDRILQRWTHVPSGRVYNLSFNPPNVAGKDDVTGEALVQREDDNAETFVKRLASFHKQTEPMLHHYRSKADSTTGVLDIDAKKTSATPETLGHGDELYVNLRGDESKQIWPHLFQIVSSRFPDLATAKAKST